MGAGQLSPAVLDALARGDLAVVFDGSTEGVRHEPGRTARIHSLLQQWRVSPRRCVYLAQDRAYGADYRTHCAALSIEPMAVLNHDYWIWKSVEIFGDAREEMYQQRLATFRVRAARRGRRFVSLNRTIRPHKALFLMRMLRDGLWDSGYVSFGGFSQPGVRSIGKPRPSIARLSQALQGFDDLIDELAPQLDVLEAKGQVLFGQSRHKWVQLELSQSATAVDLEEYDDSWFSVVTETDFRSRRSRITEKILKPLVNFHPALVLGNPGALRMVRALGFVTFEEIFHEAYDDDMEPRARFDRVYGEFTRLCRADESELQRLEARVQDKLIFNARWGMTQFPAVYRRQYEVALVNEILAAVEGRHLPIEP